MNESQICSDCKRTVIPNETEGRFKFVCVCGHRWGDLGSEQGNDGRSRDE